MEANPTNIIAFNRSEWIANYMYHWGETVCRAMQEINNQVKQILGENELIWIVTCEPRYEWRTSECSTRPIYGRGIQETSDFFKSQAIKFLDALIIVYWEKKLQTLIIKTNTIESDFLKKIFWKLKYKFLWDICIMSFSELESKFIDSLFWGTIKTSKEEEDLDEIMLQVNNMLWEYDMSLGMIIPGWEKFRPKA